MLGGGDRWLGGGGEGEGELSCGGGGWCVLLYVLG